MPKDLRQKILEARDKARDNAITSLAGYKFIMFGYWAARWVGLNQLVDKEDRNLNPFKLFVLVARGAIMQADHRQTGLVEPLYLSSAGNLERTGARYSMFRKMKRQEEGG